MVALLQDFLLAVGLKVGLGGPSVSICISCFSVSGWSSSASGVCVLGDDKSVRGDLCAGAGLGLEDERLFDVCFSEFTLIYMKR